MRPHVYVAIALIIAVIAAGIIFILGFSTRIMLPVYLMIYFFIVFAIIIYMLRNQLTERIFIASILLALLAVSATLFLTNLKTNYDLKQLYGNPDNSPELKNMQALNDYYSAYSEYLTQRVQSYLDQDKILESQLISLGQLQQQRSSAQQTLNTNTPSITPQISIPQNSNTPPLFNRGEGERDD